MYLSFQGARVWNRFSQESGDLAGWWYSCNRESERFHFATVLLHENPSSSQLNANRHANKKRSTEQDQIHACHCMSLPSAPPPNTQYYLQAGYGVACAVASAEMALFAEALRRRCLCGTIIWRRRLCRSIMRRRCVCGSIMRRCCLWGLTLQICHPETSPLWFDLADSMSLRFDCFAAWPCRFVVLRRLLCGWTCRFDVFAVWPVGRHCFCGSTLQIHRLLCSSTCRFKKDQF
jgi:hypothetical protein